MHTPRPMRDHDAARAEDAETMEDDGADLLVGATLDGRYELLSELGRGGMSVVYLARQAELERDVAVKVLDGRRLDPTSWERFMREARTAASLRHPHIVDVYDIGTLPDGRPYFVMPRIVGVDLAALLAEWGPVGLGRALELLRGPASALDLVHSRGMVHRDVKPANLMLSRLEDGTEHVQLLDFGIAAYSDGRYAPRASSRRCVSAGSRSRGASAGVRYPRARS